MLHFLYKLSITNKLRLLALFVSGTVMFLASLMLVATEFYSIKRNIQADLFTLGDIISYNAALGLMFDDRRAVEEILAALQAKNDITAAQVRDLEGRIFAQYRKRGTEAEFSGDGSQMLFLDQLRHMERFEETGKNADFYWKHVNILIRIDFQGESYGSVYIQSNLHGLYERLFWYIGALAAVAATALLLTYPAIIFLQRIIAKPIQHLLGTVNQVSRERNYSIRVEKNSEDEIGRLIDGVNDMLRNIEQRDHEIIALNQRLNAENQRMSTELEVTRRLQQMVLPSIQELQQIRELDIAGFMEPAEEVGGDYYDVLPWKYGIKIAVGDVTGHGLESGVLILMVQTAVRTLAVAGIEDPRHFMDLVNRILYANLQRTGTDKNMTLLLLDYQGNGVFQLVGQHEKVLLVRANGCIEVLETVDLGFMLGIKENIRSLIQCREIKLEIGDGLVLYTDGIIETGHPAKGYYGLQRLCKAVTKNWGGSAEEIREAVIQDVSDFVWQSATKVFDDITLLVIKRETP